MTKMTWGGFSGFGPLAMTVGLVAAMPAFAGELPAPYVSRALDAVLIPIDAEVQSAFGLAGDETGVLVLATAPGGVADQAGIEPGDVIGQIHGKAVIQPIMIDEIVYYWIGQGSFDFGFDGWRGGAVQSYSSTITLESYTEVIDVTTVSTWSSYSYESFSYSEYSAQYSSEIEQSYSSSEATIEETVTSEEFVSEETTMEETATDEAATDQPVDETLDTDADGTPDAVDTDDDNDGEPDATDTDDNGDGQADE